MQISVVIPTCNRKARLLSLLKCLDSSAFIPREVIIVDSGEDRLLAHEISSFGNLHTRYMFAERSVCIQRNAGIRAATSPWIFLCDDDIEPPADYLKKLVAHISDHPRAGAVSGLVLQKETGKWVGSYPITSRPLLLWKYVFAVNVWGPIQIAKEGFISRRIAKYFRDKGNHISKAGWPVLTDFSGDYFTTPVYGLGASLVKKEWLLNSPFDEALDRHGIGDNYGVALGFPGKIHVLNNAFVYHHQEKDNRLQSQLIYYRRALALDYFRRVKPSLRYVKKRWLLWSLAGNLFSFALTRQLFMIRTAVKTIFHIASGKNSYPEKNLNKTIHTRS